MCVCAKILDCEMETQYRNEKSVCEHWENESSNVFSGTLNPTHSRIQLFMLSFSVNWQLMHEDLFE